MPLFYLSNCALFGVLEGLPHRFSPTFVPVFPFCAGKMLLTEKDPALSAIFIKQAKHLQGQMKTIFCTSVLKPCNFKFKVTSSERHLCKEENNIKPKELFWCCCLWFTNIIHKSFPMDSEWYWIWKAWPVYAVEILLHDSIHYKGLTLMTYSRQVMWLCLAEHNYCDL